MLLIKLTYPLHDLWSIKMKRYFFSQLYMCNLKTDKQYDTKKELYSHDFIYATQALLNMLATVHQFLWANKTKLWYVRAD